MRDISYCEFDYGSAYIKFFVQELDLLCWSAMSHTAHSIHTVTLAMNSNAALEYC